MVEEHGPNGVRLVRNPEFGSSAPDARPDGFSDEIVWSTIADRGDAVDMVAAGDSDALLLRVPPERLSELSTRFTSQIHVRPSGTMFIYLDTTTPPFDEARVRQAVSYAVDRDRIVELVGGRFQASVTCQIIQPNFYGYRRICPHTSDPDAGVWTGPDFARARSLVAEAGAAGASVRIFTISVDPYPSVGEYVDTVLRELGLRPTLTVVTPQEFGPAAYGPERQAANGVITWFPDYPAPSSFIEVNFACSSSSNLPRFCDPGLDERMQEALELQSTDPVAAAAIWAELDAAITEQAPWVPLVTFNNTSFVSDRVGNVQLHPQWGILLDQLWVQ
ncbi:MAG: ABC transporter substrate-binding protein [Actinomycetota bacterium]